MIFVTVGTHEQQFDRLISHIDKLVEEGKITEEVVIQTGFSTYEPKHCRWSKLLPHKEVKELVHQARVIITHGGPASFMMPLLENKIPIVVPRQLHYHEHVNDHQVHFCREVARRQENIILVEEMSELENAIINHDQLAQGLRAGVVSGNEKFMKRFCEIVDELVAGRK